MRTKLILQLLLLSLFVAGLAYRGHTQEMSRQDRLQARLDTLGHDSLRLWTYHQLAKLNQSDTSKCRYFTDELFKEAIFQQNNYFKVQAYVLQLAQAYNAYDTERLESVLTQLEPLAREEKLYKELFFARRCAIDMQLLNQNYEYCERAAHEMLNEAIEARNTSGMLDAYQCLANIYRSTYRPQLAVDMLEHALPIAIESNKISSTSNIYQALISLYEDGRDMPNWLKTLNHYLAFQKWMGTDKNPKSLILYSSYLNYYTLQKDWAQAEKFRMTAESCYRQVNSPLYKTYFDRACVNYYRRRGLFDLALERMDTLLMQIEMLSSGPEYYNDLGLKAHLLYKADRPGEALPIYKEIIRFNDSLQVATINKQYEQLKKDYNADQLLLEQAQLQHKIQLYTLLLLGVGLLFTIYFLLHMQRTRRTLQKAEREMREINQQMELANQAKDRFLSNISTSIRTPLNTVVDGSLQLAEGRIKEEKERLAISTEIRKKARLLLQTINDILDLSRLEAGMMKFESTDVEITSTMLDAISSSDAFGNEVEIHADFAMDVLYLTHTDGTRLAQIFKSFFDDKAADAACIVAKINFSEDKTLDILITGSVLTQTVPAQEVIIRNEINRMLIEKFGGIYEFIDTEKPHDTIHLTLSVDEVICT